jgi:hypothetical protein
MCEKYIKYLMSPQNAISGLRGKKKRIITLQTFWLFAEPSLQKGCLVALGCYGQGIVFAVCVGVRGGVIFADI